MPEYADVPKRVLDRLRKICLGLPEAYEEQAWAGTRWRIRKKTFAHVLTIDAGWPPAYAKAAESDGPLTLLTFRSEGRELAALSNAGHPFYRPDWAPNVVAMALESGVDWTEVAELLTESYCIMAPQKLIKLLDRPE